MIHRLVMLARARLVGPVSHGPAGSGRVLKSWR